MHSLRSVRPDRSAHRGPRRQGRFGPAHRWLLDFGCVALLASLPTFASGQDRTQPATHPETTPTEMTPLPAAASEPDFAPATPVTAPPVPTASPSQWINTRRWNALLLLALLLGFNLYFIERIKAGKTPFIRKIAGLEAVGEAVGRATEMGRPILFVPGIQDMNDIQTVAGITVLGHIARTVAEYDSQLVVPTSRSLVMATARETVKEAYLAAGRPDSYDENNIYYVSDEQFGYVAGVNGYMVRERPATCFYMGAFLAESLILSETGNSIGAIQVAGTAMPAQLPFFVAACDYTLIGEEFFAASAYLSGEPKQLGSIKGQDVGKLIGIASIVIGVTVLTAAALTGWGFLAQAGELLRAFWSLETLP